MTERWEGAADALESRPGAGMLLDAAWSEAGREGTRPAGWLVRRARGGRAVLVGPEGAPVGLALVAPGDRADRVVALYAAAGPERARVAALLLRGAWEALDGLGRATLREVDYGFWRAAFPEGLARAFAEAGLERVDADVLTLALAGGPAMPPVATGYRIEPFTDDRIEEAAMVVFRSPEPGVRRWSFPFCWRLVLRAAGPRRPFFPEGIGQMVLRDAEASEGATVPRLPLVSVVLCDEQGHVHLVYTLPEHSGRGLATAALVRALDRLAARGLEEARIVVNSKNPRARRLYERLGFRLAYSYPIFHGAHRL